MVFITEVNSFVQLVATATKFAGQLQDGWYKGSAEVEKFQQQVVMLRNKHDQWSAQLHRHGLSNESRLLLAASEALQALEKQQQYVSRLQNSRLLRWRKRAFPGLLSLKLEIVLANVDAGPQLVAESVARYDMLERRRAQTPAPLPFVRDPKYVPISKSVEEIRNALETPEGSRVVTVYGGPGLGKTSAAKYLALQYAEERKSICTPTFPDGVYYLFCGQTAQRRVDQVQLELVECLGFGASASAPTDLMAGGAQQGQYFQQPSAQLKLRSRLFEQKLLIILDDLWEGEVLQQLLVPAQGVKHLITSQMKGVWASAKQIRLQDPTESEARHIMANYTQGLPTQGVFPDGIQGVTGDVIRKLGYHPLALANVGISINEKRVNDERHWKAILDNIHGFLDNVNNFQDSPTMYDQRYSLPVGASMMLMVESLPLEALRFLFLMALLGGQRVPEALVKLFYQLLQGVDRPDFLLQYNNQEKYLEDRSLVTLDVRGNDEINESILAAHELRMHFIRHNKAPDLQSLAHQMLSRSTHRGGELIRNRDTEETLVTVLSDLYYEPSFKSVVVPFLENHLRIINDGVTISQRINSRIDILTVDRIRKFRACGNDVLEDLVYLLDVDHGETGWKQQARECAKRIIIKLACQGQLDDSSMVRLIELPQATSTACGALANITSFFKGDIFPTNKNDSFSSAYPTTMKALLTLMYDDATSTRRRVAAVSPLLNILEFLEGKDTILKVGHRLTDLLAMDSNPTLQMAIAGAANCRWGIGKHSESLEVLIGLLVSGKDYELRMQAGRALSHFADVKIFAFKVVIIPDVLAKLLDLFLSKPGRQRRSTAGRILAGLASVPENRSKFRGMQGRVEGLGDILSMLKETWRASHRTGDLYRLERWAKGAARILGELSLDKELREVIARLPGLEEDAYVSVYWTRAVVHLEMGAYREALEDSVLAQNHLCSSEDESEFPPLLMVAGRVSGVSSRMSATTVFSRIGVYARAMLKDYAGVLLAANSTVDEFRRRFNSTIDKSHARISAMIAMIERGIVKRLSGDLQGALDDFNLAIATSSDADCLKNRGNVKHLMGNDVGARQDAEAAQHCKLGWETNEETIDFERFWLLQKQPTNYLGYSL